MDYDAFWALSKREQADLIFKTLFIDHSPISESCRGVLTVLQKLGLDPASRDLAAWRECFDQLTVEDYTDKVFELGRIKRVVMTNDPFDDLERPHWEKPQADARFLAALRIDQLLLHYPENWEKIKGWGYDVDAELSIKAVSYTHLAQIHGDAGGAGLCSGHLLLDPGGRRDPIYLSQRGLSR